MESKTYYIFRNPDNPNYPVYHIINEKHIFKYTDFKIKEIIQVEPDYSKPDLKFTEYEDGIYATNYINEIAKISLLDVNNIDKLLFNFSYESFGPTYRLYSRFLSDNRLDLCDYLIEKNIKLTQFADYCIFNFMVNPSKESLMYIIDHNDFFQISWETIFKSIIPFTRDGEITDYLITLMDNINYKIDYDDIIKNVITNSYTLDIKNIEPFIEKTNINLYNVFKYACSRGKFHIINYLLDKGIEYDFYELIKCDISTRTLNFFIEKGYYLDGIAIDIIINSEPHNIYKMVKFMIDQKYLTQDLITKQLLDTIIKTNINNLRLFINDFYVVDLVDLDMIIVMAIELNSMELINWCINNGININKYMSIVMKKCRPTIISGLIELGAHIPNDKSYYDPTIIENYCMGSDCIPYLKTIIEKEFDTAENIIHNIIENRPHVEILKYLLTEVQTEHITIPKLTNVIIRNYYYDNDYCPEYYEDLIKSGIQFDIEQQTIIQIIEKKTVDVQGVIFSNCELSSNLKILFVTIMTDNIDILEFLLEINKYSQDYLQWALIFSSNNITILEYIINNTNVDPISFKQEMSTMARHNNYYSIDYLRLNGFYTNNDVPTDSKLADFMNEIGIDIFNPNF